MNLNNYPILSDSKHEIYEFLSEGSNGTIKKVVLYQNIVDNVFNIAFGDWSETLQRVSDQVRSNNNDRDKVLATIAFTVLDFMKFHPDAFLFAKGITSARTRLYQIGISNNWQHIGKQFIIMGFYTNDWQPLERGKNYQAFLLKPKRNV